MKFSAVRILELKGTSRSFRGVWSQAMQSAIKRKLLRLERYGSQVSIDKHTDKDEPKSDDPIHNPNFWSGSVWSPSQNSQLSNPLNLFQKSMCFLRGSNKITLTNGRSSSDCLRQEPT